MDNHISRSMLEHFEIANGEHDQEISKIANSNTLRSMENGSLHFITLPRDQEFIDHTLLNPEYLSQFPNGFIVDFITNGDGEQQAQQIITDAVSSDLPFANGSNGTDEQDRRLTAALLQFINKPCHLKAGNETQVIVATKDLTLSEQSKQDTIVHHSLNHVDNQCVLQKESSISDSHLYQSDKTHHIQTHQQVNPPLPPLTPIRRLQRHRKNSIANTSNDIQIYQVNDLSVDDEIDNRHQRPLTKKSLPHKKRISKKLKTIERIDAPSPIRQTVIYQDIQQQNSGASKDEPQFLSSQTTPFSCQLCATICTSQLDFFAHLKGHYEPEVVTATVSALQPKEAISSDDVIVIHKSNSHNNISFNNFSEPSIDNIKIEHQSHLTNTVEEHDAQSVEAVHRNDLHIDEVEFSDTEDMLEGIRGVVDKVQESVGNDSNDGNDWYSGSSLNGNIVDYKTDENNQSLNTSVENFSIFFKHNLKGPDGQEIMIPVEVEPLKMNDSHTSTMIPESKYLDPERTSLIVGSEVAIPIENEIQQMLIADGHETHQSENEVELKIPPKRSQRTRKQKIKEKPIDDDFSEGGSYIPCDLSSDEDNDKSKKQRRKCTECDKVFNSSNAFKYHVLSHTGERPHQCDICGKSFFAQSALKVHMRLHSGAKPYECEICKRAFRQWGDLKYHTISIHTDERNFQCEFCGKAFARRYSLVIHRRIHTSERNYKCEFCPKSFRASSYLQNHRKVHTGEKPYACQLCGKKFRVSGDLKRHTNIHGREKKKKGSDTTSRELSKSSNHKSVDLKAASDQIIQFVPKPNALSPSTQIVKNESDIMMDLNLLQDDFNAADQAALMKIDAPIPSGNAVKSPIFKTEIIGIDRY